MFQATLGLLRGERGALRRCLLPPYSQRSRRFLNGVDYLLALHICYIQSRLGANLYLPGTGWIDFDPTNGSVGNITLVTVATAPDPRHAIPLHGTFFGFPSDHLGMEVQVSVTSGTPTVIWAAPQPSPPRRFGQSA